jgi:hypothetical protein
VPIGTDDLSFSGPGGILEPQSPTGYLLFQGASTNNSANIFSTGANLQFIHTVEAGSYEFDLVCSVTNESTGTTDPDYFMVLSDSAGTFYSSFNGNPAVLTFWEPFTLQDFTGPGVDGTAGLANHTSLQSLHGVVDLGAAATSGFVVGGIPTTPPNGPFNFGTFNLTVKKLA